MTCYLEHYMTCHIGHYARLVILDIIYIYIRFFDFAIKLLLTFQHIHGVFL